MSTVEREMVAAWNRKVPVGTMVRYWRGVREGDPSGVGPTEGSAFQSASGAAGVFIKGTSGYIALSHVEVAGDGEEYRPSRRAARPSAHPRETRPWRIDQADPDTLRAAAHAFLAAIHAALWQRGHLYDAHASICMPCSHAMDAGEHPVGACAEWLRHQAVVDAGWGAV